MQITIYSNMQEYFGKKLVSVRIYRNTHGTKLSFEVAYTNADLFWQTPSAGVMTVCISDIHKNYFSSPEMRKLLPL